MSIPFFNDVLGALGKRLNYESVVNLFGNSFCKDAGKYVQEANPLYKKPKMDKGFLSIISAAPTINVSQKTQNAEKVVTQSLSSTFGSDVSWAEGLFT